MADKRPAYQRYPKDYLSDENVALMSLEQEGAYNRLMDYCWLQGSIPADVPSLARLCRVSDADMERIWPGVEKCFRRTGDRYTHPRLDIERRKQDAYRKAKSDAGKAGAKAKHEKDNSGSATVLPVANPGFSSSFASSFASVTETSAPAAPPPDVEKYRRAEEEMLAAPETGPTRTLCTSELAHMAETTLGMGLLQPADLKANRSLLIQWEGQGRSLDEIADAIEGLAAMIRDRRPEVRDWLPPGKPVGLRALQNTHTLYDQGDGKARRPLWDVATEYARSQQPRTTQAKRGGGLKPITLPDHVTRTRQV